MYLEPIITLFTDFNSAGCAKKKKKKRKQEGCRGKPMLQDIGLLL